MSFNDSEMHMVAAVGACVLTAALSVPTVLWATSTSGGVDDDHDDKVVIEASLAMRKSPKPQPQKQFRQPDVPDKPVGVSRDDNKPVTAQCCNDEADCDRVQLAFPTRCPGDGRCDNNRCKPNKQVTKPDDGPVTKPPDRTGSLDDPTGAPTDNTVGEFDGSKQGTARTSSGDPWMRELANDFMTYVDFPRLEAASDALACLHILEDGTIKDTTLRPPTGKRSDNDGLNAKIEIAFKKITEDRQATPRKVPTHLLKQVVTKWTCIPIDAQTKQD